MPFVSGKYRCKRPKYSVPMYRFYFCLNWLLIGLLFVFNSLFLNACEIKSITVDNNEIISKKNFTFSQNKMRTNCFHFFIAPKSIFKQNDHGLLELRVQLNGNCDDKIQTNISFIGNQHLKFINHSKYPNNVESTLDYDVKFIFDLEYGVR